MVPHLVTALTGPINELEQRILESMPAIEPVGAVTRCGTMTGRPGSRNGDSRLRECPSQVKPRRGIASRCTGSAAGTKKKGCPKAAPMPSGPKAAAGHFA